MSNHTYADLVSVFTQEEMPRVWSLLVSVFGDLAQSKGAAISSSTLNRITADIGIKPEATRVALHRLRREGWLEVERVGRSSRHRLSAWGLEQSRAASPRIYTEIPLPAQAWLVIEATMSKPGAPKGQAIRLAPNVVLTTQRPAAEDLFVTEITDQTALPDWMQVKLCPPDLVELCAQTAGQLERCKAMLPRLGKLSALQSGVLRILIVHSWRRIALRAPDLPTHVFASQWQGKACREVALDLLARLPVPALDELDALTTVS